MLSLFLSATDVQALPLALAHIEMQNALIQAVFQDIDPDVLHAISQGEALENLCGWPRFIQDDQIFGVTCHKTTPMQLGFVGFANIDRIHYEYLPPFTECFTIMRCAQCYALHTRLLPRGLRELNMSQNKIYGTIDMQNLPQKIEVFDVSRNLITGPISLRGLPPTLRDAYLWNNRIDQRLLPCDPLPSNVMCIALRGNSIGEVCFSLREAGDYGGNGQIEQIMREVNITTALE